MREIERERERKRERSMSSILASGQRCVLKRETDQGMTYACAHEGELHVGMRVDTAGDDEFSFGFDRFCSTGNSQIRSDLPEEKIIF